MQQARVHLPRSACRSPGGETCDLGELRPQPWYRSPAMDVEDAIRSRRTHKAFAPEPVAREVVDELLDLALWAPNHHLTNPWRFRVLGPASLARLKEAAGPGAAQKLDRAPTLI